LGARPEWRGGWAGWRETLYAEWTKLRTLPGTGWLLAAFAALTFGVSEAAAAGTSCPAAGCDLDPAKVSLTGVYLGQATVAVFAVLMVSGEYSTGMIRLTFAAMPRRIGVLAAKAVLAAGLTLIAGAAAVLGSVLFARLVMPGRGFTAANGYPPLSLADGAVLRAAAGSVLYLVLVALLSLGVAALVRDAAAATGISLGLLYLSPIIAAVVTNPTWHDRLERYLPMNAGLAIQATRNLASLAVSPWAGLGVLAAWAGAALLSGAVLLRLRDA
jgi:ABC-2 type transport system permease protein